MGSLNDLFSCAPVWLPMVGFLAVLLAETIAPSKDSKVPAFLALLTIGCALFRLVGTPTVAEPFGLLTSDALARTLEGFLLVIAFCVVLMAEPMLEELKLGRGEFHALLLASLSGMLLLVSARDLLLFFLGIELLSIPLYVLAAYRRLKSASVESGFKYFLLGAFASGFLVYGIALLYGACGSTHYRELAQLAADLPRHGALYRVGLAMLLIGVGFKAALAPFHSWVPDVYHGAPTPVTAFMAAGVKTAAFGAALRLGLEVLPQTATIEHGLAAFACLSMVVGNLGALLQTNLKRMLAWSSIAHAGYLLVGVAAAVKTRDLVARDAVLFYLGSYSLMTLGAFGIVEHLLRNANEGQDLKVLRGMSRTRPYLSFALALCFLSLAGIPLTAGFLGKLYLIQAAWSAGLTTPTLFLAVMSVVSLYYYLRVIATLYMDREEGAPIPLFTPTTLSLVTAGCCGAILLFGVWPAPLLRFIAP